uniref:Lipid droplet-regulating VLDL assembly factor AUP1 n=1 Tax=Ornithorhynchus anatinus TaxID=9258 RepID=A0A6I8MZC8_ORNAN
MCGVLGLVVRERDPQLRDRGARVYVSNHVTPFDHNMVNLPDPLQHPPPVRARGLRVLVAGLVELDGQGTWRRRCGGSAPRGGTAPPAPPLPRGGGHQRSRGAAAASAPGRFPFRRWCQSADPPGPPAPGVRERGGRLLGLGAALGALHPFHRLPSEVAAARPPGARGGQRGAGGPRAAAGGRGAGPRRDSPHAGGQSRTPQTAAPRGPSGPRRCGPPARAPSRPLPRRPAPRLSPPPSPAAPPSPPAPLPAGPGPDGRLATLSQRVKEVLPHVPLGVIRRDLARTGCVDATITNLLERPASADRRHPPPPPPPAPEAGSPVGPAPRAGRGPATPPSAGPDRLSSGRPSTLTFAKSPRARHESLRERKEALYEQARRRFLEKHARRPEDGP